MTTVRLYTHSGVLFPHVPAGQGGVGGDCEAMLKYPYLDRQTLEVGSSASLSSDELSANGNTTLVCVEVAHNGTGGVRFEVNPNGREVVADMDSPFLRAGIHWLLFGVGWHLSLIEAN
jgi:hypothetical protein